MSSPTTSVTALATEFVSLNTQLREGAFLDESLQRLVDLAVATLPACDWAAVTSWPTATVPRSLATSDPVASATDQLQYDTGEGPCLEAADESDTLQAPKRIDDVRSGSRWPTFCAAVAAQTPVRSVLSFHLGSTPHPTALNLYGRGAKGFDETLDTAVLFAAHAHVLLAHAVSADRATHLDLALVSSRLVGAAVGILMASLRITDEEAFERLRQASQGLNRKLVDVAEEVKATGELPTRARRPNSDR